jgi:hypothetical protein
MRGVSTSEQGVPLAHAARAVHRVGLQAAASRLCAAGADGIEGAGGDDQEAVSWLINRRRL